MLVTDPSNSQVRKVEPSSYQLPRWALKHINQSEELTKLLFQSSMSSSLLHNYIMQNGMWDERTPESSIITRGRGHNVCVERIVAANKFGKLLTKRNWTLIVQRCYQFICVCWNVRLNNSIDTTLKPEYIFDGMKKNPDLRVDRSHDGSWSKSHKEGSESSVTSKKRQTQLGGNEASVILRHQRLHRWVVLGLFCFSACIICTETYFCIRA